MVTVGGQVQLVTVEQFNEMPTIPPAEATTTSP
jgi:hypothetical protein